MTIEKIKQKRYELELKIRTLELKHYKQLELIHKKFQQLYKQCPHENMNSASYTRWCNDCGKAWDTT